MPKTKPVLQTSKPKKLEVGGTYSINNGEGPVMARIKELHPYQVHYVTRKSVRASWGRKVHTCGRQAFWRALRAAQ